MSGLLSALSGAFLAPIYFWFLLLIPMVILLYLLKLRRTEILIPSTMLWMKSLQDLTANAPFQRLRKNLLLFLQILVLLLLTFALARPFVQAEGSRGDNLCLIIDRSASMQTQEDEGTRLDLAKQRALELVEDLEDGDRMMLVSFAESAEVLCELMDDRGRLRRAIDSIQASDTRSNIRDVMLIVRSLAPDNPEVASVVPDLELMLLSDGRLSDLQELGGLSMNVSFLRVGKTDHNAGIVAFSVRRPEEGQGQRQAFVLVKNEAGIPLDTTLSLYYEESTLAVEELHVPPRESRELIFELPQLEAGMLRAELDTEDLLDVDDRAWLALRPEAYLKVLLVSDPAAMGAYFLRRVLTLDPRVEVATMPPQNYADTGEYDLTIFNGWVPPSGPEGAPAPLPAGSLVFINTLPQIPGLSASGAIENPPVLATEQDHPVMRFLNPGNIRIAKALQVTLPNGARTLVSTSGGPLIADLSRGGQQMLAVTFDLGDSNWPLHLSFPLFVQNLLSWIPRSGLSGQTSVATGESIEMLPMTGVEQAKVRRPDGVVETVPLDPLRPVFYGATARAGAYEVSSGDRIEWFAVNLLDKNESSITPAESLNLGRTDVAPIEGPIRFNREFWRGLIAAGLLVLSVEWWIFSRRAWM